VQLTNISIIICFLEYKIVLNLFFPLPKNFSPSPGCACVGPGLSEIFKTNHDTGEFL